MNEEDVMETSIMHLCIPDYKKKKKDREIVPSDCSLNALSVFLNEKSNREYTYHFPVYDITAHPPNTLIVKHLSCRTDAPKLGHLFEQVAPVKYVIIATLDHDSLGQALVSMKDEEDAKEAQMRFNGFELEGSVISVQLPCESVRRS